MERAFAGFVRADEVEARLAAGDGAGVGGADAVGRPGLAHQGAVGVVADEGDELDVGRAGGRGAGQVGGDVEGVAGVADGQAVGGEMTQFDHAFADHGDPVPHGGPRYI
ncbi:hypothetical protein GCM10010402_46800 [Actinomadura luteofluorescens]|nr:hypothetical protein [Actinomadura glauciflava]